jgi:hypothetical protein
VFPVSGNTSSTISYTVYPHFGTKPRSARITIGSASVVITQAGMTGSEDSRFVRRTYFNALRRLPSASEEQGYVDLLKQGTSRSAVMLHFLESPEFRTNALFVTGLYRILLGRVPEYSGWTFQLNAIVVLQTSGSALTPNFLTSPEWSLKQGRSISDEMFVTLLYKEVLQRFPSADEVRFQLCSYVTCVAGAPQVSLGVSARAQMATSFLGVPEFFLRRGPLLNAVHAYFVILGRDPTPEELRALESEFAHGTAFAEIVSKFVNSAEHAAALR